MMNVTAFDFGQADSFLVRGGKKDSPANVLIDCGSKKCIGTGLYEKLRMKNVKELDLLTCRISFGACKVNKDKESCISLQSKE